jgi:hypothetical protein
MTNELPCFMSNFKRRIYIPVIFLMIFCHFGIAQAQNNAATSKSDSLYKANQSKMQQDSQDAANKKAANVTSQTSAQKHADTRPISQRVDFDINTSFWINRSSTFFEFSPVVAYKFPRIISIGAGPAYIYNRDRIRRINLSGWGGKVFGRAQLMKWIYAYTEYQGINNQYITGIDLSTNKVTKSKEYVDSWFLSLGINIRITKRHGLNLQALYDVLYNKDTSPYFDAWTYRIGFRFL